MVKTEVGTRRYNATFQLDPSGQWLAELEELPQVHSFGKTLGKAREYLVDALALWLDVPAEVASGEIHFRLPALPNDIQIIVEQALAEREIADAVSRSASDSVTEAAMALVREAHLSLRDAGDVLGLSHQRIQQLVSASGAPSFQPMDVTMTSVDDIAKSLRQFLPGGEKEELGAIAGAVALGLAIAWIESRSK